MGKNSDIHNIFDSYLNKVILNEAVKPTEGGGGVIAPEIERLRALLTNPTLSPEDRAKAQASLDILTKGTGSNTPPAGTMTVDQAKQVIANQQAQNTASSQGTVAIKKDETVPQSLKPVPPTSDAERQANFDAMFPPRGEYEKREGIAPSQASTQDTTTQSASTAPQAQQSGVSLTDPNSISLDGQSPKPADDFQNKLDANYSEFKKSAPTPQQSTQPAATKPATKSSDGGSIVNYLAASGQKSDFASRSKMAADYGIQNYKGTAEQNTQLLNKLKANEKMPQGTNATGEQQYANKTVPKATAASNKPSSGGQQGMGGVVGGASKAVGSAGQGLKQATIGTKQPLGGVLGGISKAVGSAGKGIKKALVGDQGEPEKKEESEETFVRFEKTNIAKFLKFLSEKNYAEANKYLKKIVECKVKRNILKNISSK